MPFTPQFLATGIGSMPFADPAEAVQIVLDNLPEAPMWPQLPRRDLLEQMETQYSGGLPRAVIDREKERLSFDVSGDSSEEMAEFYENYITAMDPEEGNGDCSPLALAPEYAAGLYEMKARLEKAGGKLPFVKVQTTGPISFALTVTDENKRALYYNDAFLDMAVKALAMKSRWQIQTFAPFAEKIICFIDEPILSAFGSSTYVSVTRDDVVARLGEVIEAVHADGALAGVHCCGNTEWSILVDAGADIVNFDAFGYGDTIAMYPDAIDALLAKGGALAWGVVPTSEAIRDQAVESLVAVYEKHADALVAKGLDKNILNRQACITPSCGTGSMKPDDAKRVFEMTKALSTALREKYGF